MAWHPLGNRGAVLISSHDCSDSSRNLLCWHSWVSRVLLLYSLGRRYLNIQTFRINSFFTIPHIIHFYRIRPILQLRTVDFKKRYFPVYASALHNSAYFPSPRSRDPSAWRSQLTLPLVYQEPILGVKVWQSQRSLLELQFSSVAQSCPTLCDPMNRSTPGLPVHHQLPQFTQTHVHRVRDAIQPSHPRSSPSPPAPNPSQHQSLFQWVNSSHEVAKVLELQL